MAPPTEDLSRRRFAGIVVGLAVVACVNLSPGPARADANRTGAAGEPEAVWPTDPHQILQRFDPPECLYCAGHRGVDLAASPTEPVRAAVAGTITFAGVLAGRGVLVVDDGRHRVTYEPVTASVTRGDVVAPGDLVGSVELVGSHCFPDACLHVGLIDDDTDDYEDPLTLFPTSTPVRLLPLWNEESSQAPIPALVSALGRVFGMF